MQNLKNISKSLADYFTSSNIERAINGTAQNIAREYVKTGMALKNTEKLKQADRAYQLALHEDAMRCLQRIADRVKSPKTFCQNLWQIQTLTSDMLTFNIMECDPFDVKLILTKQNEEAVVTRHAFTNTLKQVIVRTTAREFRQAMGLNNIKMADLDCIWEDVVLNENLNGSKLLNELEEIVGVEWS